MACTTLVGILRATARVPNICLQAWVGVFASCSKSSVLNSARGGSLGAEALDGYAHEAPQCVDGVRHLVEVRVMSFQHRLKSTAQQYVRALVARRNRTAAVAKGERFPVARRETVTRSSPGIVRFRHRHPPTPARLASILRQLDNSSHGASTHAFDLNCR